MKVLLVDDHRLLLEGLENLLSAHGIDVVGMAKDGNEALPMVINKQPDVILMDIRMPNCDGLEATRNIILKMPSARIVMLTTSLEDEDLFEAVKIGAFGYLLKSMDAEELVEALYQVQKGIPPFAPGLASKILHELSRLSQAEKNNGIATVSNYSSSDLFLTPRERQVLELVASGLTYKQVALELELSPRTVKYYMTNIMGRLHMHNRAQVIAFAGKMGMGQTETPNR